MSHPCELLKPGRFDDVLFDMDGVLTSTATIHAASWKATFDEFLAERGSSASMAAATPPPIHHPGEPVANGGETNE